MSTHSIFIESIASKKIHSMIHMIIYNFKLEFHVFQWFLATCIPRIVISDVAVCTVVHVTLQGKIVLFFFLLFIICCVFGKSTYSRNVDWMIWPERFKWIVLLEWWILRKSYRYNEFKVRDVVVILNLDIAYIQQ